MTEAPPPATAATNGLAIASLICGIAGCIPGAGIAAAIMGHMALGRIKISGQGGRGMAIVGLILGYLSIVGWIIVIIATIAGTMAAVETLEQMETMPQIEPMP
ncbi:MAG TPA: DUF4190 domain-containing protein [Phycisphaerae bacterium]|nr:DUF4190 domain-containing protein [Phycisphaerae bacterium]